LILSLRNDRGFRSINFNVRVQKRSSALFDLLAYWRLWLRLFRDEPIEYFLLRFRH
jgi:hypothetical protein